MRINKFLSEAGVCSRREADRLVKNKKVKINNITAELGDQVSGHDLVYVGDKRIKKENKPIYIAFHKPVGVIVTTDRGKKDNIMDLINHQERIFPVGRLDVMSSGLILLTNDGSIVNKLLKSNQNCDKEYLVNVNKKISLKFLNSLKSGVFILGRKTLPAKVKKTSEQEFLITITQGMNRQIRRMCSKFGYEVLKLKRIRIKNILLGNLPPGKYRELTAKEIEILTGK